MKYHSAVPATSGGTAPASKAENADPKPKRTIRFFALHALRLAELARLAQWRAANVAPASNAEAEQFFRVAAFSIAGLAGMRSQRTRSVHPGLDFETAVGFLNRAGLILSEEKIMNIIHLTDIRIDHRKNPLAKMSAPIAGQIVKLVRFERDGLDIRTIEATDETAKARAERRREEKRIRDRERLAEKRRQKASGQPKAPRGESLEAQKPWLAEGISRRTYYRRKACENDAENEVARAENEPDGTALSRTSILKNHPRLFSATDDIGVSPSANVISLQAWMKDTRRIVHERAARILDPASYSPRNAGARKARPASESGCDR